MKVQGSLLTFTRSLGAFAIAFFCLWLFPSPAFDACSHSNNTSIVGCGTWPDLLMGFLFVTVSYLLGPSSRIHYLVLILFFTFLGSAENIRFGSFYDALYQAPFQEFYYGGFVAAFIFVSFYLFTRIRKSVPNK
jgi:hypothetical protein